MYILIRNIFVLSLMAVLAGGINAGTAFADVIYVNDDATGLNNGSSWADAYTALDEALGEAVSPDDIWVAAGIYQSDDSPASFNLVDEVDVYGGFAGDEDPEDPNFDLADRDFSANKTELDGQGNIAVVYANSLSNAPVLDGFTIYAASHGVYCYNSDQTVKNCVIFDNTEKGIFCNNSDAIVKDCTIFDNGHDGIYGNNSSNIQVSNCSISDNGEYGLKLGAASTVANSIIRHNTLGGLTGPGQGMVMINNLIYDNTGNGIHFTSPDDTDILRNNTIVYNEGVGIKNDNAGGYSPAVSNCIVWGNTADQMQGNLSAVYSCIQGGSPGTGNIAEDPDFVLSDPNDFHIRCSSPCRDAGDPEVDYIDETDIDGETRVFERIVDIGADEFVLYADINLDCKVNYSDFGIFANVWLTEPNWNPEYDFDNDGIIDFDDLLIMAGDWNEPNSIADIVEPAESNVDYRDFAVFAQTWRGAKMSSSDFDSNKIINMDDLFIMIEEWLFDESF